MNILPYFEVPRMDIADFDTAAVRTPTIIEGFDIGNCLHWTPECLMNKLSSKSVTVHKSTSSVLQFQPRNFTYETCGFDEFLKYALDENSGCFYYLRSLAKSARDEVADFRIDFSEIKHDVIFPPLFSEDQFFSSVFRVSSAKMELWTHFDTMDNYLMHIYGHKRVYLMPPKNVSNLYVVDDKPRVFDLDNVSLESFPNLRKCTIWKCMLNPGDILFIPAFWFHNVKALDFSISVNVFWKSLPPQMYDPKDVYGNSALMPGQRAMQSLDSAIGKLKPLPDTIRDFYIRNMIMKLETSLKHTHES